MNRNPKTMSQTSSNSAVKVKKFHFWWMLSLGGLEKWLNQMAEEGLIFDHYRIPYTFVFRKDKPAKLVYVFDLKNYLLADYYSSRNAQNWFMYNLGRNWIMWTKPHKDGLALNNEYDDKILKSVKSNSTIHMVIVAIWLFFLSTQLTKYFTNTLFFVIVMLSTIWLVYNLFKLWLYKAMLEARNEKR